jgi:hypothetical protein
MFENTFRSGEKSDGEDGAGEQAHEHNGAGKGRAEPEGRVAGRQAVVALPVLFQTGGGAKAVAARLAPDATFGVFPATGAAAVHGNSS